MENIKNKDNKIVLELNDYEELVDEELKEKIKKNKYQNVEKPILSVIIVKIIGVLSLIMSIYIFFTQLYTPIMKSISENDMSLLLQIFIYGGLIIINIFAAISLFLLNNLGRIIQFIVLFIFIALKVFYIFYDKFSGDALNNSIWEIVVAGIACIILMTKPISKAF